MKEQLIQWLVTNCSCWKGDKSKEVLNTLEEDALKNLKLNAEKAKAFDPLKSLITNVATAVGFTQLDKPLELVSFVTNSMKERDEKVEEYKKKSEEAEKKTTTNSNPQALTEDVLVNALKSLGEKKVLELFPSLGTTVKTAAGVVDEKRHEIMGRLVANAKGDEDKKRKLLLLKDKSLDSLREMLEFAGVNNATQEPAESDNDKFLRNFFNTGTTTANDANQNQPAQPNQRTAKARKGAVASLAPSPFTLNSADEEVLEVIEG